MKMYLKARNISRAFFINLLTILCSCCDAFNLDTDFPVIFKGSKGSYFGYTTALHKNRWGYLALVGAPKANTTTFSEPVHQPGTIYRCNITRKGLPGRCQEIFLMQEGAKERNNNYENAFIDKKDNMWLGVSLDVRPNLLENDIVTCGHLWKNQIHRGQHLVNGVCYVINGNLEETSVKKLLPLTQRALQLGREFDDSLQYQHAFGQVGMSLAFSEDGSKLILGAPGVWSWTGSAVIYGSNPDYSNDLYRNPSTPLPPFEVKFTSYFGYSVTIGNFFDSNTDYFAIGAPREGYNGKVFIVRNRQYIGNRLRIHQKKQGVQMGEYFGASILAVNVNGDSYTDLLVGAPLYSLDSAGDEGKVYVYISNGKDLQKHSELTGDLKENARFGTALANIGDLNQDGFFDIAVGAPYEDKNGAVYIYHGSRSGIKSSYAQKVKASSLNSRLSGFGIHISRGMDIDNNGYPDILIGSYASSNAVLLRSRPFIRVYPELMFTPKRIAINQTICDVNGVTLTCVSIDACLWYTGKYVPSSLDFHFTVSIKDSARRGFFTERRTRETGLNMILDIGTKICSQFQLYLNEDVKDVITPIPIQFSHELVSPASAKNHFNETIPIYHPSTHTNITSEVPFHTGCGKDDECHSDLIVSATRIEPKEDRLITLGKFPIIAIQITVKNIKEPAYLAELLINIPSELPTIKYDYFCDVGNEQNNASLVCSLGNPLRNGSMVDINIKLDATKIPPHTKYLEIVCRAITLSIEANPSDNVEIVPLHLKTIADIGITATSSDKQIMYDEKTDASPVISHTFTIMNHGPSPLETIDFFLNVPYVFLASDGKKQFVPFTFLEKDSGTQLSIPAVCDDASLNLTDVRPIPRNRAKDQSGFILQDKENSSTLRTSKDLTGAPSDLTQTSDVQPKVLETEDTVNNSVTSKAQARGYIVLNCARQDIECITFRCTAAPFANLRKFAQISVGFQLNFTILDNYLDSWYQIEFLTNANIAVHDETAIQMHHYPNSVEVKTTILREGPPPSKELSSWIIFVSVGVGVLLLILILIILIKVGFFRRKEKDRMKELLCDTKQGETSESDAKKGETNPQPVDDSDAVYENIAQ